MLCDRQAALCTWLLNYTYHNKYDVWLPKQKSENGYFSREVYRTVTRIYGTFREYGAIETGYAKDAVAIEGVRCEGDGLC